MSSGVLNCRIPVDVAQLSQTEAIVIVARIRETVNDHRRRMAVKYFPHPAIQLVVSDRRPIRLLLIGHRLHIDQTAILIRIVVRVHVILIGGTVRRWRCLCQIRERRLWIVTAGTRDVRERRAGTQMVRVEAARRIADVVRHVRLGQLLEGQQRVPWHEIVVPGHEHGGQNGALDTLVVVRIDADFLLFGGKGKLTEFEWFEFVVALQVGPTPHTAVDHVR